MKKLIAAIVALGLIFGSYPVSRVLAGVTCSLPFNLQNNTVADATQVMANYNALVACFTSTALAGANNDITSLAALTSVSSAVNYTNATNSTSDITGAVVIAPGGLGVGGDVNMGQGLTVAGRTSTGGLLVTGTGSQAGIINGALIVGSDITSNAGDITWNGVATTAATVAITASSGTFTSVTGDIQYKKFGKVVIYQLDVIITNAGTASGNVQFTLPTGLNPVRNTPMQGAIDAPAAVSLAGRIVAGTPGSGTIVRFDGTSAIFTGAILRMQGWFENP